jgi:hypothetical protein
VSLIIQEFAIIASVSRRHSNRQFWDGLNRTLITSHQSQK